MRRLIYILLLLPMLLSAQTYHAFVGDVQGGFSGEKVGANVATRIGYGLRHGHFLFRFGAGVGYDYLMVPMPDRNEQLPAVDSEHFSYTQLRDYTDRRDHINALEIQAPVFFGGEWQHIYFLLGATVGCRVYGSDRITASLTTAGDYDMFFDPFVNMPNHGYTTVPYESAPVGLPFSFNLYASAELGTPIGKYLRLGAFADYPVLKTSAPAPYRVGVRLSVWVGRETKRRFPCNCLNNNYIQYNRYDDF